MLNYHHVGTFGVTRKKWLSDISDLEILTTGGRTLLLATTEFRGAGVSSYLLPAPDRLLRPVDTQPFLPGFTYQRDPDISLLNVRGETFLHHSHLGGAENLGIRLAPTGVLDGFEPIFTRGGIVEPISALGQYSSLNGSFLYLAHQGEPRITVHKTGTEGRLVKSGSVSLRSGNIPPGSSLDEIIETHAGGNRFLVAISKSGDFISTHRVTDSGDIAHTGLHVSAMGTGYTVPTDIEAVQVGGHSYVIVASGGSSTLTVFQLFADGKLKPTDHVLDEGYTSFQAITALETVMIDGRAFIFVGGVDDGISIFTLQPDGRLLHLETLADRDDMTLADVSDIEARVIDNKIALFVSSASETGITQLVFDPGRIGMTGSTSTDRATGTADNDLLIAKPGTSMIWGGEGDDILIATTSSVKMFGGPGADIFVPANTSGRNLIKGFEVGLDHLDLSQLGMIRSLYQIKFKPRTGGVKLEFQDVTIDIITSDGTALTEADFSNDLFPIAHYAPPKFDVSEIDIPLPPTTVGQHILGTSRNDRLSGSNGPDMLVARQGNDAVSGGAGNDSLHGDDGHDRLAGGTGDDLLHGGPGPDTIKAGSGNDRGFGGQGHDTIYGSAGHDSLAGSDGRDHLSGDRGNDELFGNRHEDKLAGGLGNDTLSGGGGDDLLIGAEGDDHIWGGTGNDKLYGNHHRDKLIGGRGNDTLLGGSGDDILIGTEGVNRLWGMQGQDRIIGGTGRDLVEAGTGHDVVAGRQGADRITGHDGNDILSGNGGDDLIRGGTGNDKLQGNLHRDLLIGGQGNDIIRGGEGNDTLVGGLGADRLNGGAGRDVFRFNSFTASKVGTPDIISDFRPGWDDIDLTGLDLDYVGNKAFTGDRQLRWESRDKQTHVCADLDGNGQTDMAFVLTGRMRLTEDDFIF